MAAACALFLIPLPAASEPPRAGKSRLRIETQVPFVANLVHWVDNLAGTSAGKTMPVYQSYWEGRFGPPSPEDRAALERFGRISRLPMPPLGTQGVNRSGCLPVGGDGLSWHQVLLAEAMAASSLEDLAGALSTRLSAEELSALMASIERFRPRFERVWKDLGHVRRFEGRFHHFLAEGSLASYLESLADFFGVDAAAAPPIKISFIGLPADGGTHAEADGDHLLIEIRPSDDPRDQVQVVAHEVSHFLMRQMSAERIDALARQAFETGEAGALVWRYMWEGLPTALGQGLAEARVAPRSFSMSRPWYHTVTIDRFAKLIYPAVAEEIKESRSIHEGVMARVARTVQSSALYRRAHVSEFLMTAFFASGEGMAGGVETLRRRLGSGHGASAAFSLEDPEGEALLRRYSCLPGVALVAPNELDRAVSLDGKPALSAESLKQVLSETSKGFGVIAAGRRQGGGLVYYLVAPDPNAASGLIDTFARLRGVPGQLIQATTGPSLSSGQRPSAGE